MSERGFEIPPSSEQDSNRLTAGEGGSEIIQSGKAHIDEAVKRFKQARSPKEALLVMDEIGTQWKSLQAAATTEELRQGVMSWAENFSAQEQVSGEWFKNILEEELTDIGDELGDNGHELSSKLGRLQARMSNLSNEFPVDDEGNYRRQGLSSLDRGKDPESLADSLRKLATGWEDSSISFKASTDFSAWEQWVEQTGDIINQLAALLEKKLRVDRYAVTKKRKGFGSELALEDAVSEDENEVIPSEADPALLGILEEAREVYSRIKQKGRLARKVYNLREMLKGKQTIPILEIPALLSQTDKV